MLLATSQFYVTSVHATTSSDSYRPTALRCAVDRVVALCTTLSSLAHINFANTQHLPRHSQHAVQRLVSWSVGYYPRILRPLSRPSPARLYWFFRAACGTMTGLSGDMASSRRTARASSSTLTARSRIDFLVLACTSTSQFRARAHFIARRICGMTTENCRGHLMRGVGCL